MECPFALGLQFCRDCLRQFEGLASARSDGLGPPVEEVTRGGSLVGGKRPEMKEIEVRFGEFKISARLRDSPHEDQLSFCTPQLSGLV